MAIQSELLLNGNTLIYGCPFCESFDDENTNIGIYYSEGVWYLETDDSRLAINFCPKCGGQVSEVAIVVHPR
jgi:hypothetical protein